MASTDHYATAKTNLRDNVKTLVGIFAGIAGLLLAGTPFTGYGALDPAADRWWIATGGLIVAVALVGLSVLLLLRLLQPDLVFQSVLRKDADLTAYGWIDRDEIRALRREFDLRRHELLPVQTGSIEQLDADADQAYDDWQKAVALIGAQDAPADLPSKVDALRAAYEDLQGSLSSINNWAAFSRLRYRVVKGCNLAFALGFIALLAIGAFSWAVGQKKEDKKDVAASPTIIVHPPVHASETASFELHSILFDTGRADFTIEGMRDLGKARDYMREHPGSAALAFAYTDTRGSNAFNRALAARRAKVVRDALISEGGVSASRVFVAELPETDLPTLTGRNVNSQNNRSVQLMLLDLPPR